MAKLTDKIPKITTKSSEEESWLDIINKNSKLREESREILAEIAYLEKIAKKARENGLLHIEKAANGALRTIIEEAKQADSMADPNASFRSKKPK